MSFLKQYHYPETPKYQIYFEPVMDTAKIRSLEKI